jgi:hypothetical protein
MCRLIPILVLALSCCARADDLQTVSRLAEAGAWELALRQADARLQTSLEPAWVTLRIKLLQQLGRYQELLSAVARLPEDYPAEIRERSWLAAAQAAQALKRPELARSYLAKVIWRTSSNADSERAARRQVVLSYLADDVDTMKAYPVWLRYVQDFPDPEDSLTRKAGLEWLATGQVQQAISLLPYLPPAGALSVLIRLHAGMLDGKDAISLERGDDFLWWLVRRQAAINDRDPVRQLEAEEYLLQNNVEQGPPANQVWLNYMLLAQQSMSGTEQVSEEQWLDKSKEGGNGVPDRALLAWLAMNSEKAAVREGAQLGLLDALIRANLPLTVLRLFREGLSETEQTRLSDAMLYRLGLHAESMDDLAFADKLWTRIDRVPPGIDATDWCLRRASLFARAGNPQAAVEEAMSLLEKTEPVPREMAHRLQQLAQSILDRGQYAAAERLLAAMLDKTEPFQQRDVLYALGEAAEQRGDMALAAARYLEAATLESSDALDAFAQLARLQAALALVKAGQPGDARRQYEMVLAATHDESRRELIRRALDRL